jgi:hypothetical protein
MKGKGFVKKVTRETLREFKSLLRTERTDVEANAVPADDDEGDKKSIADNPELLKAEAMFHGESIRVRLPSGQTHTKSLKYQGLARGSQDSSRPFGVAWQRFPCRFAV